VNSPRWLYDRIDKTGRIPKFCFWLWPSAHWCLEMDGMLILGNLYDCFCEWRPRYLDDVQGLPPSEDLEW
jgi:hypothetical protein